MQIPFRGRERQRVATLQPRKLHRKDHPDIGLVSNDRDRVGCDWFYPKWFKVASTSEVANRRNLNAHSGSSLIDIENEFLLLPTSTIRTVFAVCVCMCVRQLFA